MSKQKKSFNIEVTNTLQISPTTRIDVMRKKGSNELVGVYIVTEIPNTNIHQNVSISAIMFSEVIKFLQEEMKK